MALLGRLNEIDKAFNTACVTHSVSDDCYSWHDYFKKPSSPVIQNSVNCVGIQVMLDGESLSEFMVVTT